MYGIVLVLIIALLGGLIALLGDRVGMKVGKKRLSLFGLRPKHTSMIITVVTGILISGSTLLLLTIVSQDVRTALFRMKIIQQELVRQQQQLDDLAEETKGLKENKIALEVERERLRKEVQAYSAEALLLRADLNLPETERVIFLAGEILAAVVVEAGADPAATVRMLQAMLAEANRLALERGARQASNPDQALRLGSDFTDLEAYAASLATQAEPGVLRLVVTEDTKVFAPAPVAFEYFPNGLVFRKGEVVAETEVSPYSTENEVLNQVLDLLLVLRKKALLQGMISERQYIGENLSLQEVSRVVKELKTKTAPVTLQLIAAADTWRIKGPVAVGIRLVTKDGQNADPGA